MASQVHECRLELISDPGGLEIQRDQVYSEGDAPRVVEGWQLTCPDTHSQHRQGVIVYNRTRYASFHIESILTKREGKIAACVASLFTERKIAKPWIAYSTKLGIESFNLYHALVSNFTADPWLYGIWPSSELAHHAPLNHFYMKESNGFLMRHHCTDIIMAKLLP